MDVYQILWSGALTIGVAVATFMLNRVANTLDALQKTDKELSKEVSELKANSIMRSEVDRLMERLENRIENYHAMHVETSKIMFAKLDLINDKIGDKISRQECLQLMSDRRQAQQ